MKYFKHFIFFTILFCLAISTAFGQKRKVVAKKPVAKKPTATKAKTDAKPKSPVAKANSSKLLTEISDIEWNAITDALEKENWALAARLSSIAYGKLRNENDKKQLAQLRYFYLFSLAGKAANGEMPYPQLEEIADSFIGSEFLMPSREFLADCTQKVNYICAVKDDDDTLRVTATNKSGSEIHWFEYVKLTDKVDVAAVAGKSAFIGGTLERTEINDYQQSNSILRLIFDKGFVNIVASR